MIEQSLRWHRINPAVTTRGANPEVKDIRLVGMDVVCRMQNPGRPGTNRTNERRMERFSRVVLREIRKCRAHIVFRSTPSRVGQELGIGVMLFTLCITRVPPAIQLSRSPEFGHDCELLITHVFNAGNRQPGK